MGSFEEDDRTVPEKVSRMLIIQAEMISLARAFLKKVSSLDSPLSSHPHAIAEEARGLLKKFREWNE